jgi:hypothetical protein
LPRIIRNPGWTTPAEFAFTVTILESMQVKQLGRMSEHLLDAGKLVSSKRIAENG